MPRYYFNLKDGRLLLDDEGVEIADLDGAHKAAVTYSGEVLRDGASGSLWSGAPWRLWVTDQPEGAGNTLFTLVFSAVQGSAEA
jgi:hypothetical protein